MKKHTQHIAGLVVLAVVSASCGSMQPVSQVRDDIYFMPSEAPPTASLSPAKPTPSAPHEMEVVEDYFDQGTSQDMGTSRSFYDMAYNDPHYYNYGRFGFGSGMGMGGMGMGGMGMGMGGMGMGHMSGWNGPGWGMSMGYGWGSGMGMGGMGMGGMGMGGMGWGSPFGWYDPWDPWNRWDPWSPFNRWNRWNQPWGMGGMGWGMNQFGGGWGMGNYWGPFGNCMACYSPVVVGGSSNTYIGHRSSMGAGGGSGTGGNRGSYQPRMPLRDPVSLDPVRREAARPQSTTRQEQQFQGREQDRSFPGTTTPRSNNRYGTTPRTSPQLDRGEQRSNAPQLDRGNQQRTAPTRTSPQRSEQQRSGGFDRGGSSPSMSPSRGGGGAGGGGSRPSGGGRPR